MWEGSGYLATRYHNWKCGREVGILVPGITIKSLKPEEYIRALPYSDRSKKPDSLHIVPTTQLRLPAGMTVRCCQQQAPDARRSYLSFRSCRSLNLLLNLKVQACRMFRLYVCMTLKIWENKMLPDNFMMLKVRVSARNANSKLSKPSSSFARHRK